MMALALVGGPGHPGAVWDGPLRELLGDVEVHDDVGFGLAELDPGRHDLLVVAALAFSMADARYDAVRAEQAHHLGPAQVAALAGWLEAGRPVLALHAAVISFDDWPGWGAALGATWDWQRSWHPPVQPVRVVPRSPGTDPFTVVDERYSDLALAPGLDVVATADEHPVAWRRVHGRSRVAVCLLGHDHRSLAEPGHRALLSSLVSWLREDPCPT